MSIKTVSSDGSDGEHHNAARNKAYDTFEKIKEYLCTLHPSFAARLTRHASHTSHEDVQGNGVKPCEDAVSVMVGVLPSSIPPDDPSIPSRLQTALPPANFGTVVEQAIYRSAYPQVENYGFLKSLGLKTILTLVPEKISPAYEKFMTEHGIQHFQVHIPANKGSVKIGACDMSRALEIVLDRRNHPMLIHCNKGKHRTGCVVGCFRRVQGEESETVYDEYHTYAGAKARLLDEAFIEQFDENTVLWMARRYNWIPPVEEPPSPVGTLSSSYPSS